MIGVITFYGIITICIVIFTAIMVFDDTAEAGDEYNLNIRKEAFVLLSFVWPLVGIYFIIKYTPTLLKAIILFFVQGLYLDRLIGKRKRVITVINNEEYEVIE